MVRLQEAGGADGGADALEVAGTAGEADEEAEAEEGGADEAAMKECPARPTRTWILPQG